MNMIESRAGSGGIAPIPVISWAESDFITAKYFAEGWLSEVVKVSEDQCLDSLNSGDVSSNGIYLAGVWDACSDTWFTTQAWREQLPLIVK